MKHWRVDIGLFDRTTYAKTLSSWNRDKTKEEIEKILGREISTVQRMSDAPMSDIEFDFPQMERDRAIEQILEIIEK